MMNTLMSFENQEVEVITVEERVLFNANDVAKCLDIKDVKSTIRNFKDNQKVVLKNSDVHTMHYENSDVHTTDIRKFNNKGETFLTEAGLYKLIFKSRKEEAEKFQDWVTDEVLPSIRKNGGYVNDADKFVSKMFPKFDGQDRDAIITMFKENMEKAQEVFKKQEAILIEQQKEIIKDKEQLQQATQIINQAYIYKNQAEKYIKEQDKRMRELLVEKEKRFYNYK